MSILFQEEDAFSCSAAIFSEPVRLLSAITALETAIVTESRRGPAGGRELDLLIHRARIEVVPFTAEHFAVARRAHQQYGKGNHPAKLNFGDCCSYALAKYSGEPLLAKGNDFSKTDIRLCGGM